MRVDNKQLPGDWTVSTIEDIAEVNPRLNKAGIPDDLNVSFVPMPAVGAADGSIDVSGERLFGEVKKGFTPFQEGDVLFAKITPCMENGKMAIVPKVKNGLGFGSTEFHVLRPKEGIDARYIYYYVSSKNFRGEAERYMSGAVGQKRVTTPYLKESEIPVAPPDQQKHIVAEIEKQFSRLDEAVANLKRVKANLKRYKAAVLKAAVEGRLVETEAERACREGRDYETGTQFLERILETRRKHWGGKGKYKEPVVPNTAELPELPEGWVWATMPQLGELNRGKSKHRPRNDKKLFGGAYPFIQTGEVRESDGGITKYVQTYSEFGLGQSRLWPKGTLCITIAANIAETGILRFDACFPDSVVGFLMENGEPTTQYVDYFIRTAKEKLERFAPATAQKNINLEVLTAVSIPLPPLTEQHRIVAEVDRRLSLTREVETQVNINLQRAERLRQAILSQAFSGGLLLKDAFND